MLAVTVADPDAIAIVALVIAVGAALPGWLNWHARRRQGQQLAEVRDWVRPNGGGTLPEMSEQILERIGAAERGFTSLQGSVVSLHTQVIDHDLHDERRFSDSSERMNRMSEKVSDLDRDMYEMAREMAAVTARIARLDVAEDQP